MNRYVVTLVVLLLVSQCLLAADPTLDGFVPILLPLKPNAPRPGALGSVWSAEVTAFNASDHPVPVFGASACQLGIICPRFAEWEPNSFGAISSYDGTKGYVLWVPETSQSDLRFNLTVREETKGLPGTSVPVLRSDQFIVGETDLLLPAVGPAMRVTLRGYSVAPEDARQTELQITLFNEQGAELGTQALMIRYPTGIGEWHPIWPLYGQLALSEAFPSIIGSSRVRVRVKSTEPGRSFWVFVSITDNVTNAMQVVSPN